MVGGLGALGGRSARHLPTFLRAFDTGAKAARDASLPLPSRRWSTPNAARTPIACCPAQHGSGATVFASLRRTVPRLARRRVVKPSSPVGTAADANTAGADALVAQRAVLYEEPLDSHGGGDRRRRHQRRGDLELRARAPRARKSSATSTFPNAAMKIKMYDAPQYRRDPAGEPSRRGGHRDAGQFPRQGIRDVPRLVLKPREEARGQPLIGASAKVADGFFWIALSGDDADVASNLSS